ncbi:hypothetical protein [Synoicihabitans lomoniglobus]|uniref:Uncharacterized protein n=1 Tax=Synoicihabitans lomoniglobus TaxID=2909285 RepID=A0AAF0CSP8_9BACT|nr:hypothetical protein [Opitutaceae bacterium LMO-M01]WED67367.1 hypothetical protein PXH66_10955 [Opitutaceae bacterium LMO-M01]
MPTIKTKRRYITGEATLYLSVVLAVLTILWWGFDLRRWNFEIPLNIDGDALHYLAIARSMLESAEWWRIDRLSAPFELNMLLFPFCGMTEIFLLNLWSLVTDTPGSVVFGVFLSSFVLAAASACWSLRTLGYSPLIAATAGILFAFIPSVFLRNTAHLMLLHYMVPFPCATAVLIASDTLRDLSRTRRWVTVGFTCVVGLSYIYTAFFGCFLLCVAALIAWARRGSIRATIWPGAIIAVIAVLAFFSLLPSILAWKNDLIASDALIGSKSMADSDTYGLKLRHLITPRQDHPLSLFRDFTNETVGHFPLDNENTTSKIGGLPSLGLLTLLFIAVSGYFSRTWLPLKSPLIASSSLAISSFLLATIGGLGSLFNLWISSEIRCYNRISVFIAFLAIVPVAYALQNISHRIPKLGSYAVCTLVVIIGVLDQASFGYVASLHHNGEARYLETKEFITKLENELPEEALIYQLPHMPYPHTPPMLRFGAHSHLLAYVTSTSLNWSWPALTGEALTFNSELTQVSLIDFVTKLSESNFSGILVNTTAYEDKGAAIVENLEHLLTQKALLSTQGEYAFVAIPATGKKQINPNIEVYLAAKEVPILIPLNHMVDFSEFGDSERHLNGGWSHQETDFRWTVGPESGLQFFFKEMPETALHLSFSTFTLLAPSQTKKTAEIFANDRLVGSWVFDTTDNDSIRIVEIPPEAISPNRLLDLRLIIDPPSSPLSLGVNADSRPLGIAIRSITISN